MGSFLGLNIVGRCGVVVVMSLLVGCSFSTPPSATKISEVRQGEPTNRETIERSVSRREFQAAVERSQAGDKIRLVPVFRRETGSGGIPEHRLFDVRADSPYGILGLETADVLVAANDYLVFEPEGFRRYVKLLGGETVVSFEVVRGGKLTLVRTTFTE